MELKEAKSIELNELANLQEDYAKCKRNTIVRHALSNGPVSNIAFNKDNLDKDAFLFNVDIPTMTATNQQASGRCWIFAACNVLREKLSKEKKIKDFELSQNFIAFYDRLEKINYCLESIIDLLDRENDDRTLNHVLDNTVGDGGQWDMFVSIVKKYGLCPKGAMPESFQSNNTRMTGSLINAELRKFAYDAKRIYKQEGIEKVRELKEDLFKRFYNLLVSSHGLPQTKFDFEYRDENNEFHVEKDLTPKSFFDKYFSEYIDEFVSVTNAPTKDKPFNKTFTISYLGNVIGGKQVQHLNVSMDRLSSLIVQQLKDGQVTWFGSDCGKFADRESGLWDDQLWDYPSAFDLDYGFNKECGLDYRASVMNHAMVLTGVHLNEKGLPLKWKVENSWGTDRAFKGYYIMSNSWFNRFVFQAVINKKYLNEKELKAFEEKPIVLKPWDPMGSLAD